MIGTLIAIPILFSVIHLLEFTAIIARLAGIASGQHLLGYSVQQAVLVGTRIFMVLLLPLLGLVVDMRVAPELYWLAAFSAVIGSALCSAFAFANTDRITRYFSGVIACYRTQGALALAFLRPLSAEPSALPRPLPLHRRVAQALSTRESNRLALQASVVFAIYSSGIFVSFHAALSFLNSARR